MTTKKKYVVCWVEKTIDKLAHRTVDYNELFEKGTSASNLTEATECYHKLLKGDKTQSASLCMVIETTDYTTFKKQ